MQLLMMHVGPTEFLYYWLHRALHWHPLYQRYHSHHHASFVTEPITGSCPRISSPNRSPSTYAASVRWRRGDRSWPCCIRTCIRRR